MSTENHDHSGDHAHADHGHGAPIRAEPDIIPVGPVIVGVAVIIVIFLVGIFWAYRIQRHKEALLGASEDSMPLAAHQGQYEVGIINQEQFEREHRAYDNLAEKKEALQNYGWA